MEAFGTKFRKANLQPIELSARERETGVVFFDDFTSCNGCNGPIKRPCDCTDGLADQAALHESPRLTWRERLRAWWKRNVIDTLEDNK
jgi:hypothetical protein